MKATAIISATSHSTDTLIVSTLMVAVTTRALIAMLTLAPIANSTLMVNAGQIIKTLTSALTWGKDIPGLVNLPNNHFRFNINSKMVVFVKVFPIAMSMVIFLVEAMMRMSTRRMSTMSCFCKHGAK